MKQFFSHPDTRRLDVYAFGAWQVTGRVRTSPCIVYIRTAVHRCVDACAHSDSTAAWKLYYNAGNAIPFDPFLDFVSYACAENELSDLQYGFEASF